MNIIESIICSSLEHLEKENKIHVLFAVESGSRSWGFESPDSDYDVRFVFSRSSTDYMRINPLKDVIEYTEKVTFLGKEIILDLVGFDMLKFARLLLHSNPSCIEWLQSSIIYKGPIPFVLLDAAYDKFNPKTLYHHYKSISWKHYASFIESGKCLTRKKYLYALRGALASRWLAKKENLLPPINFEQLLTQSTDVSVEVVKVIKELLALKRESQESHICERIDVLDQFIIATHNSEESSVTARQNTDQMVESIQEWIVSSVKG